MVKNGILKTNVSWQTHGACRSSGYAARNKPLTESPIRLFLIENFVLLKEIFKKIAPEDSSIILAGSAPSWREAEPSIRATRPDIVIISAHVYPLFQGTLKKIKAAAPGAKFGLMLTGGETEHSILRRIAQGFDGIFDKN